MSVATNEEIRRNPKKSEGIATVISPCSKCAARGCGCCLNDDIVLTRGDIKRIRKHCGHDSFHEQRELTRFKIQQNDPSWTQFVRHARLVRRFIEGCYFLRDRGCLLPINVRPLVCRLYPYDLFTEAKLHERPSPEEVCCPREFFTLAENVAEYVGVQREDAVAWHKQLYEEIGESQ